MKTSKGTRTTPPGDHFITGMGMSERSFTWRIENSNAVLKRKYLINSQKLVFDIADNIGLRGVHLLEQKQDGKRWVRLCYIVGRPLKKLKPASEYLYCIMIKINNENGKQFWTSGSHVRRIPDCLIGEELYWDKVIDADEYTGTRLVVHVTFKVYYPSSLSTVQQKLKEFETKFAARARKDLAGWLPNPCNCNDIKIVASDKKEFTTQKGVLAARSPVFAAMFRANMTEANDGVVNLPDISSAALQVLLTFLHKGELHPDWELSNVLFELANAAAKYELQDLLDFLDETLGKVCDLQNVMPLYTLARRLSLKTAEQELLNFVKGTGTRSVDNFDKVMASMVSLSI